MVVHLTKDSEMKVMPSGTRHFRLARERVTSFEAVADILFFFMAGSVVLEPELADQFLSQPVAKYYEEVTHEGVEEVQEP